MRFTDLALKALPHEPTGSKKYWDEANPGFGIRCTAKSKSFIVMYGQERRLKTIGRYPDISLREARQEAKRLLVHKPSKNAAYRTTEAVAAYLEDCEGRLRHNTLREYRRHLAKAPDKPLDELTKSMVDTSSPEAIKTWKVFFNWCVRHELTDKNPFTVLTVQYGQRDRVLSDDELRAIWRYHRPPFSDHVKLLILTGQRRGQFTQYEIRTDTVYFPASVMKGKVAHELPLTPHSRELLQNLQPFNGWSNAKKLMDTATGVSDYVLHDLRRTFSTRCAALNIPLHVTEKILAHRTGVVSGVAATYNRYSYQKEMTEALTAYEHWLYSHTT